MAPGLSLDNPLGEIIIESYTEHASIILSTSTEQEQHYLVTQHPYDSRTQRHHGSHESHHIKSEINIEEGRRGKISRVGDPAQGLVGLKGDH